MHSVDKVDELGPAEVLDRGMDCLLNGIGSVETERFISTIIRERFDYTEWQKQHFDSIPAKELFDAAVSYTATNPPKVGRES